MVYDHSRESSTVGLVREGSQSVEDSSQTLLGRQLKHCIGADFSSHPLQYQRILTAAEAEGFTTELITEDGVINIKLRDRVLMRIRLDPKNLQTGLWEDKIAIVFGQVRLMRLIEKHVALRTPDESGQLTLDDELHSELQEVLGIPAPCSVCAKFMTFPGARQLQILHDDSIVASLIYNPILKLVLEFRMDPMALLQIDSSEIGELIPLVESSAAKEIIAQWSDQCAAYGLDAKSVNNVRKEINLIGEEAQAGLMRLAEDSQIQVLALGDSHLGFGDQNRRAALRLMRKMQRSGITHFAIPLPHDENPRLAQALAQRDVRRFWLERAAQRASLPSSAEWTAMLQRAHDVGMRVTAVGICGPDHICQTVKRIERILKSNKQHRVLLWLENPHLAKSVRKRPSLGALLKQQFGVQHVVTVATIGHQQPDVPLKILTESSSTEEKLKFPVLLRMAEAAAIRRLPWSLGSAHRYDAWDYVLLYPGTESRFQAS